MSSDLQTQDGGEDIDFTAEGVMCAWPKWLVVALAALVFIACLAAAAGSVL